MAGEGVEIGVHRFHIGDRMPNPLRPVDHHDGADGASFPDDLSDGVDRPQDVAHLCHGDHLHPVAQLSSEGLQIEIAQGG